MTKSKLFHPFLKKESFPFRISPSHIILKKISNENIDVKTISVIPRIEFNTPFGSERGSSITRKTL